LKSISSAYERKFYPDEFNDFAARMQWAAEGKGNHNPVVRIHGEEGYLPLEIRVHPGVTVRLDASGSSDPDGDKLRFHWWFQEFPDEKVRPEPVNAEKPKISFKVPASARKQSYHLICEVHDDGPFQLVAYRRIIITVE
jgi:hypothetical protein